MKEDEGDCSRGDSGNSERRGRQNRKSEEGSRGDFRIEKRKGENREKKKKRLRGRKRE